MQVRKKKKEVLSVKTDALKPQKEGEGGRETGSERHEQK